MIYTGLIPIMGLSAQNSMSNNETKCFFYGDFTFRGTFAWKTIAYCLFSGWCFLSKMLSALVIATVCEKAHRIKPRWMPGHAGFF